MAAWKRSKKNVISRKTLPYRKTFLVEGSLENAGHVAGLVKTTLQKLKIPPDVVRRVAIVTYEAEMNICSYAKDGKIVLSVSPDEISVEALDKGEGIPDIERAMEEGYSTATEKIWQMGFGAGMGLSNMRRFSDDFSITSEIGRGTHVKMKIRINSPKGVRKHKFQSPSFQISNKQKRR